MDSIYKLGVIFSVIDKVTGPTKKISQSLASVEKNLQRTQSMIDYGNKMAVSGALVQGAADQMQGSLGKMLEPVTSVNDKLAALSTVTTSTMGSMIKSMELTKNRAIAWEQVHKEVASQFIETSYMMASAGLNDMQAIYGTETALKVATATFGDHAEAADLIATSYNNMGNKNADVQKEMGRLGDIITRTQQLFQIKNLNQLAEGLKYGMPAAIQARMEYAQLNTVIGQLNNAGLKGSMAGTAFAATMRQMSKASQALGFQVARGANGGVDLIGTLENINKKYGDLSRASPQVRMAFQKAFGEEGLRAIVLLSKQTGQMRKNLDAVRNSAGAAAEAQGVIEGTEYNDYIVTMNNVRGLRREMGMQLLPTIKELIPEVRSLIQSFSGFVTAHPRLTKTMVLLFAVGTAILSILAPILTVAASFMIMGGYGLQGILKMGKGIDWLVKNPIKKGLFPGLKQSWGLLKALGKTGVRSIGRLGLQFIRLAARVIPLVVSGVWSFTAALLANPITWVIVGVIALSTALYALYKNWDMVKQVAGNVLNFFSEKVTAILSWLDNKVTEFRQSGVALLGAFVDGLKSMIGKPADLVAEGLQKVRNLLPFSDAKEGPLSTLTKSGLAMIQTFQAGAMKGLPKLQQMMSLGFEEMPLALAGAGGTVNTRLDMPDFSGLIAAIQSKVENKRGQKPVVIQGDLILNVDTVDSVESLVDVIKRFAREVSDD